MKDDFISQSLTRGLFIKLSEISGCWDGLDVLEKEPITWDNPLFELDDVIITPHAAGYSTNSVSSSGGRPLRISSEP